MLSALRLYAQTLTNRTIVMDKHSEVVADAPITNPTADDLRALAHVTFPEYPASDFMVRYDDERGCWLIEYLPY